MNMMLVFLSYVAHFDAFSRVLADASIECWIRDLLVPN